MGLLLHIIVSLFSIVLLLDHTLALLAMEATDEATEDNREMPETNVELRPIVATGEDSSAVPRYRITLIIITTIRLLPSCNRG